MPWFKVDDGFHSHPKVVRAGNAACGLWSRCGSWSSDKLTDGFVPVELARTYGTRGEIARLVETGLWHQVEGGYQMHDFDDYNPAAEEVRELRAVRAEAGRRGGINSGTTRRSKPKPNREANGEAIASAIGEAEAEQKRTPSPSPSPSSDLHAQDPITGVHPTGREGRNGHEDQPIPIAHAAGDWLRRMDQT